MTEGEMDGLTHDDLITIIGEQTVLLRLKGQELQEIKRQLESANRRITALNSEVFARDDEIARLKSADALLEGDENDRTAEE